MSKKIHCDHCEKEIPKGARYLRLMVGIGENDDDNLAIDASEPEDFCDHCVEDFGASILRNAWRIVQEWPDKRDDPPPPPAAFSNPATEVPG